MASFFHTLVTPWVHSMESLNPQGWEVRECSFQNTKKSDVNPNKLFHYHKETHRYYRLDSDSALAMKCFLITLAMPFYFAIKLITTVAFYALSIPAHLYRSVIDNLPDGLSSAPAGILRDFSVKALLKTYSLVVEVVRLCFYSLGMFFASIGGWVIDPYRAREQISKIEEELIRFPVENDFRIKFTNWTSLFKNPSKVFTGSCFYLAFCFQPYSAPVSRDHFLDGNGCKVNKIKEAKAVDHSLPPDLFYKIFPCVISPRVV